jgi:hypothetical protein
MAEGGSIPAGQHLITTADPYARALAGAHAQEHEEAAIWWCAGDGGHAVTPIGERKGL